MQAHACNTAAMVHNSAPSSELPHIEPFDRACMNSKFRFQIQIKKFDFSKFQFTTEEVEDGRNSFNVVPTVHVKNLNGISGLNYNSPSNF